ncbi:MAG: hypothetical protein UX35_C0002G0080 [Microgenomates group bacterium GW2011_GWA1_46_15]|nr:MAG: hypothetical protein UX00_C0010G0065 [Microgenomates group bacterium GW2011_GWB1_45_17]KKU23626.1 MAG: hypothetical protein UX36_C0004G0079 [Microgenomates group bacterium GW2011_GWC1_46_15]KKU24346.1 MAG: hypothetical protein UX35_C0002G0080 [Microgenomates group bacterium GW2011_GWA1_46_15]
MTPHQTQAATLFEDNFDDGDLTGWTVSWNFQWANSQLPCMNGSQPALWQVLLQRLGIIINSPGCLTEIIPDHFRIPENQNYTFEFDMTMPESMHMDRAYLPRFIVPGSTFSIKVVDNKIYSEKPVPGGSAIYPFIPNGTYHISNDMYANGRIVVRVDGQTVLDFMDTPPLLTGSPTIGFRASVGADSHSVVWFDNVVIKTLDETITLPVPYLSQRGEAWKSQEYDRASIWAGTKNTIERWGCALTSAVMILRYHGLSMLPDNQILDPSTLNTWLTHQPDGYIGDGYLNWLALTRLSKQIADVHPERSALEFTWKTYSSENITQELKNQRPTIVAVPGHFVVARGTQTDPNIFTAYDPFWSDKTTLSAQDNPQSLRTFTPSHTDLSYILVVHDTQTQVLFSGNQPFNEDVFSENHLQDDLESTPHDQELVFHLVQKPASGEYPITIEPSRSEHPFFAVYAYDVSGTVQPFTDIQNSGMIQQNFLLHYDNQVSSETLLKKIVNPQTLLELIEALRTSRDIKTAYVCYTLRTVAGYIQNASDDIELRNRYLILFSYHMRRLSPSITEKGKQQLEMILRELKE